MQFEADYYNGISPRAQRMLVTIAGDRFLGVLPSAGFDESEEFMQSAEFTEFGNTTGVYSQVTAKSLDHLISDCTIQTKLGRGKRMIDLPDGGRLETDFQDLEKHLPAKASNGFWQLVHYAETHLVVIVLALVGTIAASFAMLKYGVPAAAKYAAMATPPGIEKDLGKQTLYVLDTDKLGYFKPTKLPVDQQTAIQNALTAMCKKTQTCPEYELVFRSSPEIGANAFALPGGYVVMTDQLVALASNDDEITAVLAHELGHVKERHAMRQTLQGTVAGLIIIAITGDVSSIAAGLPTLIVNMSYTRALETEADQYALQALKAACIPTKSFSSILSKLQSSHGDGLNLPEMISSHPDTKARLIPFDKDQGRCA
jgi:Zn-dependent protease with chaperone function